MYCSRNVMRSPQVCRVVKPAAARNASFLTPAAFHHYPRGPFGISSDFAPLFRLFDDMTSPRAFDFSPFSFPTAARQTWQPRFDVREAETSYELRGELPGVEGKDIEVEFTDEKTLVVRGRTVRESSANNDAEMSGALQEKPEQTTETMQAAVDNSDTVSENSASSYVKPTVEDEETGEISSAGAPTPAETPAETPKTVEVQPEQPREQPKDRYWISERSVGSFQRTFTFPGRVDHEGVKASLNNGILSIAVPKAAAPSARKITVE